MINRAFDKDISLRIIANAEKLIICRPCLDLFRLYAHVDQDYVILLSTIETCELPCSFCANHNKHTKKYKTFQHTDLPESI